jgi:hypothetical protein
VEFTGILNCFSTRKAGGGHSGPENRTRPDLHRSAGSPAMQGHGAHHGYRKKKIEGILPVLTAALVTGAMPELRWQWWTMVAVVLARWRSKGEMERWNPSWGWMQGAKMVLLGAFYSDGAANRGDRGGESAVAGGAPLIRRLLEEEATRWPFDEEE